MKNKKILSLILCFAFIFTSLALPVAGAKGEIALTDEDMENAAHIMRLVCPAFPLAEGELTTRAEFTAAVAMVMDNQGKTPDEAPFTDVAANHDYAPGIAFAKKIGLVNNVDLFYPDTPISYAQAIKILMTALGYTPLATVKGGYPTGYLIVANDLNIGYTLNLSNDDKLTHAQATKLIFEASCADILEISASGTETDYTSKPGRNLLSVYKRIYIAEGLVDANQFTGLYSEKQKCGELSIRIDSKTYYGIGYDRLIGKYSRVFYGNDSKNTILYAYEINNREYSYTKENNLTLSGLKLTSYMENGQKTVNYNLEPDYTVIKNGKHFKASDYAPYLNPAVGSVTLISSDDDSDIELIVIREIEYGVVGNVNVFDEIIYDANKKGGMTELSKYDYYYIHDSEGTLLTIDELEAGDAVGFVKSGDKKYAEIIKYTKRVGGSFDSKSSDGKLCMGDNEYELSSYYMHDVNVNGIDSISLSSEIILHLGEGSQVIYIEEFKGGMQYGYIVQMHRDTGAISANNLIKIFGQNGSMNVLNLAKKVNINGTSYSPNDALNILEPYTQLWGQYYSTPIDTLNNVYDYLDRVVKYSLNSKGELNNIYTTDPEMISEIADSSAQIYEVFNKGITEEARPKLYDNNTAHDTIDKRNVGTPSYKPTSSSLGKLFFKNGVFYPYFKAADDVIVLKVPVPSDGDTSIWQDDKSYAVSSIDELDMWTDANSENVTCYGYDVDKDGVHMILWANDEASSGSISNEAVSGVVESVTRGINDEGEKVAIVKLYTNKKWERLTAIPEMEFGTSKNDIASKKCLYGGFMQPGDIVRISKNENDEITAALVDFDYSAKKYYKVNDELLSDGKTKDPTPITADNVFEEDSSYNINSSNFAKLGSEERGYISGYIYSIAGTNATLAINTGMEKLVQGDFKITNIKPASLGRGTVVYVKMSRDGSEATVYSEADTSSIESYFNAGTNADYLVQRSRYYDVSLTIVYVN